METPISSDLSWPRVTLGFHEEHFKSGGVLKGVLTKAEMGSILAPDEAG